MPLSHVWGVDTDDPLNHTRTSRMDLTVICCTHLSAGEPPNCYADDDIGTCRWDLLLGTKGFDSG